MTKEEFRMQSALGTLYYYNLLNMAKDKNTNKEVLKELSKNKDYVIKHYVACNPSTPVEVLEKLSKDIMWEIRCDVANNPNTPIEILTILSKDEEAYVILKTIKNTNWTKFMRTSA